MERGGGPTSDLADSRRPHETVRPPFRPLLANCRHGPVALAAVDRRNCSDCTGSYVAGAQAGDQERADGQRYPLTGFDPREVREILGRINSLDRDEWARSWIVNGDRHMSAARESSR